jgi:Ca2+/Na+ antiporter
MIFLSPILLLGLTLLFRLLGSTADEYFSPSLEMFSVKLGLPPRFAGVTLLALGNGASDVSATMNAIWNDPEDGYKMSLGALTGASVFITTVVAGSVVVANGGVVCRGAMVRDVTALGVTVVVVALTLEGGSVGPGVRVFFAHLPPLFFFPPSPYFFFVVDGTPDFTPSFAALPPPPPSPQPKNKRNISSSLPGSRRRRASSSPCTWCTS